MKKIEQIIDKISMRYRGRLITNPEMLSPEDKAYLKKHLPKYLKELNELTDQCSLFTCFQHSKRPDDVMFNKKEHRDIVDNIDGLYGLYKQLHALDESFRYIPELLNRTGR